MQNGTKKTGKPRGRPRAFDTEEALAGAMEAFWKTGYAATSLEDLAAATNLNRPSLYGAFGDKHALYLTVLERYIASSRAAMDAALGYDKPLDVALRNLYSLALDLYLPRGDAGRGCFLINTASTEAMRDESVREVLGNGLRELDGAFEARLRHAKSTGDLDDGADAAILAKVASAVLHTLAVRSRAGDTRASLAATADAAIALICGANSGKPPRKKPAASK